MFGLGLGEWLLILAVALLLFGPRFFVRQYRLLAHSLKGISQDASDDDASSNQADAGKCHDKSGNQGHQDANTEQ